MAKMDSNRRKDLLEARDKCKSWLTAIETELAEDNAEKSAGALPEFLSPDYEGPIHPAAISQEARNSPSRGSGITSPGWTPPKP